MKRMFRGQIQNYERISFDQTQEKNTQPNTEQTLSLTVFSQLFLWPVTPKKVSEFELSWVPDYLKYR